MKEQTKYNIEEMKAELLRISVLLEGHEKAQIAGSEKISYETVKNYLRGVIAFPAVAKAIIDRANVIIKNRD
jgi:hypothetical protein